MQYILIFMVCALLGFVYGKKMHLNRVAKVLLQIKMPGEQVDKVVYLVSQYNKIQRDAKKATKEAYKQSIVSDQLEKMKKEDKPNG